MNPTTHTRLHTACRRAFHAMCKYDADHLAYQNHTAAQRAEYTHLEAAYMALQRAVDDEAIAAYEQAWEASR
jgi:hypothetical protein